MPSPKDQAAESEPAVLTLTVADSIQIRVPKPLRNLTTYVLREQGDWFEDEIKFLRRLLRPGMRVLDIGANLGMYTLSMAKAVGESGRVWAFEPASDTARMLTESVAINRFEQVEVVAQALSDHAGEATFNIAASSELNSLGAIRDAVSSETVKLTTLDAWTAAENIDSLDFVKLDAEGEESRILDGAKNFLGRSSPLVMFELKHAKQVNLPLIQRFSELGFETYRLVPGIAKLVPFDPRQAFDEYLLNLFACKQDRADQLAADGVLVRKSDLGAAPANLDPGYRDKVLERVKGAAFAHINKLPYAARVGNHGDWAEGGGGVFEQMLDCYIAAKGAQLNAAQRWQLLGLALAISRGLTRGGAGHPQCPIEQAATHARIARDAGEQNRAVRILIQAISTNEGVTRLEPALPFLPALARYEKRDPGDRLNRWLVSSVLEQYVRDHAYSTYFTARKALPALQRMNTLGFIGAGMQRRFKLVSSLKLKDD